MVFCLVIVVSWFFGLLPLGLALKLFEKLIRVPWVFVFFCVLILNVRLVTGKRLSKFMASCLNISFTFKIS